MAEKRKRHDVLTGGQVDSAAEEVRRLLGDAILEKAGAYGAGVHDMIAFLPVSRQLESEMERQGLSIKNLARELRVAQYRVRDITRGRVDRIDPGLLDRVLRRFELAEWYSTWDEAHPELAERIRVSASSRG